MCEKSVKIGHFSHVFHMVFHIHTPSSGPCKDFHQGRLQSAGDNDQRLKPFCSNAVLCVRCT